MRNKIVDLIIYANLQWVVLIWYFVCNICVNLAFKNTSALEFCETCIHRRWKRLFRKYLTSIIDGLPKSSPNQFNTLNPSVCILNVAWMATYVQTVREYNLLLVRELAWQRWLKADIYGSILHSRKDWRVDEYFRLWELLIGETKVSHPYGLDELRIEVSSKDSNLILSVL